MMEQEFIQRQEIITICRWEVGEDFYTLEKHEKSNLCLSSSQRDIEKYASHT